MKAEERRIFEQYFPRLSTAQWEQFAQLPTLYEEWNAKINVVSRKDIDALMIHHVLHSMSIGLFVRFAPKTEVIDIGTGGGFPGIPLAILFPEVRFHLVDSIGKKVRVAESIGEAIGLRNCGYYHSRAEALPFKADFIVSRAAMPASDLYRLGQKLLRKKKQLNALPNGIIALKGGDLTEELKPLRNIAEEELVSSYMPDIPYFEGKKIVYLPI